MIQVQVRVQIWVKVMVLGLRLTLYQPMTAKAVMSSHKPIRSYMGNLILVVIASLIQGFASLSCFLWLVKS